MEARFSSTGMQIIPYIPKLHKQIYLARSVRQFRQPVNPVTAFIVKDVDGTKRLLTYNCSKEWLSHQYPDIEITRMDTCRASALGQHFELNPDLIPNEIQVSAINAVMQENFKTAFFNIPTGVGKTIMAVYLTSLLNKKAWGMCYKTIVLAQWMQTLEEMTTFDTSRAIIISTSKILMMMLNKTWDFDAYDIYLSTPKILTQFASKYGLDTLGEIMQNCGIGIKFYDEANRNIANITKINALTNVERTYYLSANYTQAGQDREKLFCKMFASIPIIRPAPSIIESMKHTNAVLCRYNTHPSMVQIESVFNKYGFSHYQYMKYQLETEDFHNVMREILNTIRMWNMKATKRYRTLILCNLIEHVDTLKGFVDEIVHDIYDEDEKPYVCRYHSQVDTEEKEDARENGDIIVSTHQSMGVGVDMSMIRYVVCTSAMNFVDDDQAAGRARQLADGADCYYFMFVDDGFPYVVKKLNGRLDYLSQQKIKKIYSIKYS